MMLVRMPGGRERTAAEFAGLPMGVGLQLRRITRLEISAALIEATPAERMPLIAMPAATRGSARPY